MNKTEGFICDPVLLKKEKLRPQKHETLKRHVTRHVGMWNIITRITFYTIKVPLARYNL